MGATIEYCSCGYWAALETLPGADEKHWFRYCRGCDTYVACMLTVQSPANNQGLDNDKES
jgi:hypothetical protein